jgi:hypothetical protein
MLAAEAGNGDSRSVDDLGEAELEERFAALEREDQIEDLLRSLKAQHDQQHKLPSPA